MPVFLGILSTHNNIIILITSILPLSMIVFVRRLQLSAGTPMISISTYGSIICHIKKRFIIKPATSLVVVNHYIGRHLVLRIHIQNLVPVSDDAIPAAS